MDNMKRIRKAEKKLILTILAVLSAVMAPAFCSYAEGEATPLYSFDYQGSGIDTYATYSEVDGVKTEGFRYFVKDGNLLAVDNRLNSAADGIFIHYADGDSYIGVLTRGGRLVSLGTVDLSSRLKNFKNSGIAAIVSNVEDDSRNLIVSYANGSLMGYDVVTGEELFRRGSTEAEKSLTDYIAEYLGNMIKSTTATTNTTARAEADKIAAIMEKKGYTLEELAAGGVFSSTDSLNSFVQNGVLNQSVDPDAAGGTDETNASRPATEVPEAERGSKASDTNTETAGSDRTAGTVREKETEESKGSTTDVRSSEVLKKKSAAEAEGDTEKEMQTFSAAEDSEAEEKTEEKSSSGAKEEAKTASVKNTKTGNSKVGSAVLQKKESGTGKTTGKTADGSNREAGTENGAGEASGTEGKGGPAGKETGEKSSEKAALNKGETGKETGDGKSSGQPSEKSESSEDVPEETSEKDGKGTSAKKKLSADKKGYVPVYNPDTGSYEIYSVSELLENPEKPRSENAKLDNADNRAIASLLKVKEDENNERGISLYAVVIIAVVGLMLMAVLFIAKQSRQEARQEAEREEKKQQGKGGEAAA